MSFLYPLFLLGAAAIAWPIYLHLRRQAARREIPFSSLRFLKASPPRVDSRRRIEHWVLLALRALALAALALAFARPFFPEKAGAPAHREGIRTAVLLDTSASMRRGDLWDQALRRVRALAPRSPEDGFALLTFADRPAVVLSLEDWQEAPATERVALLERRLFALRPGYGATDLGAGLLAAAEALLDARSDEGATRAEREQVVLVSDVQAGSRLGALRSTEWPKDVVVALERLSPPPGPNLAAHVASFADEAAAEPTAGNDQAAREPAPGRPGTLVRVLAHGEGAPVAAELAWADGRGKSPAFPLPGGQSRVVRAPEPAGATGVLRIRGDNHPFDNALSIAPPLARELRILYIGTDATASSGGRPGDPEMPLYFLERAFSPTATTRPLVTARTPDAVRALEVAQSHLVVATSPPPSLLLRPLRQHMERGRTLLYAPAAEEDRAGLAALLDLPGARLVADTGPQDRVLTELDREHPFLAPFSQGPFADFAKIRFWNRRRIEPWPLPQGRALAQFDDSSPAWISKPVGRGILLIFTSGWHPADSQLALSSRFVPLLWNVLEQSAGFEPGRTQFLVGEPVPVSSPESQTKRSGQDGQRRHDGQQRFVRKPDGSRVRLDADVALFRETTQPGIYTLESGDEKRRFAVNLAPSESITPPLPIEQLEAYGVEVEEDLDPSQKDEAEAQAQVHASAEAEAARRARPQAELAALLEVEGRQRHWRWVLLAVLLLLIAETLLGRRQPLRPDSPGPETAKGTA